MTKLRPISQNDIVELHHANHTWNVRLPEGAGPDDLRSPDLWSKVSYVRGLLKLDEIRAIAYDESFVAHGIVESIAPGRMVVKIHKLIELEVDRRPGFNDGTYQVRWAGNGFAVYRISDGMRMTHPVASEGLAVRDLNNLTPRSAA